MNVLVIGQGGREHAIVRALYSSASVQQIHCIPGSAGISQHAVCHTKDLTDVEGIKVFCDEKAIDVVVIGPEQPLADGLADQLRAKNVLVFGPSQEAARLESSKIYAKQFMSAAGVPTASYKVVESLENVISAASGFEPPYVLKADGLAAGKGVFICKNLASLERAARSIFIDKIFGSSGEKAILEQFQKGWEMSFFILTNGQDYSVMPLSQDHKRLSDGDIGPNTGGMGAVGPLSIDEDLEKRIHKEILAPSVAQLKKQNLTYRGLLYVGLMVTEDGPKVIEYNVRFGDPEAQVILPLLDGDWCDVFTAVAKGDCPVLKWRPLYAACIVQAAPGYPEKPEKGVLIEGDPMVEGSSSYYLHAGTKKEKDHWVTNGGRVLNAVALGSSLEEAIAAANKQAQSCHWSGQQVRTDIGAKVVGKV